MLKNFRTYHLALDFFRLCERISLNRTLRDQLDRASSSIVLNLAEGHGRTTAKDRARFYQIAYGSLRECQAILDLSRSNTEDAQNKADRLGASIYCLIKNVRPSP